MQLLKATQVALSGGDEEREMKGGGGRRLNRIDSALARNGN